MSDVAERNVMKTDSDFIVMNFSSWKYLRSRSGLNSLENSVLFRA